MCIFQCLRAEPKDHFFLLTEPPLNAPENREYTAEIMFETFNVPGLCIAVQAVLALAASWSSRDVTERTLTGTVIDSGDGVTHVIPVAEGYVISSSIKHIPLAGRDITQFVQQLMREREKGIPPDQAMDVAKRVKESYSYVCPDLVKEFAKYDQEPAKWIKQYEGFEPIRKTKFTVDVGYERFLGPEIFFNPTGTSCPRARSRILQALGRLAHKQQLCVQNLSSPFLLSFTHNVTASPTALAAAPRRAASVRWRRRARRRFRRRWQ